MSLFPSEQSIFRDFEVLLVCIMRLKVYIRYRHYFFLYYSIPVNDYYVNNSSTFCSSSDNYKQSLMKTNQLYLINVSNKLHDEHVQ